VTDSRAPSPPVAEPESPFWFDEGGAQLAVDFFREVLVHIKGEKAGQPFILDPWQEHEIIRPLFGWKRTVDGTRRYRQAYIEVPKKNGKSSLGAGLALLLLCADDEEGAEVYSVAADTDQADIVFSLAKQMRARSAELRKRLRPFKRSLTYQARAGSYKVLSAEADTKHGFNIHGCIFDELHTQPNRKLYDVLTTGVASRRQPLFIFLTTAGYDRHSICWEVHEHAIRVRDGLLEDPEFLPVIYAADPDDPWDEPATWAKANPGLGTSLKPGYLEGQAVRARQSLAYQNTFRRLHLDQWTTQAKRALDMERWDACVGAADLAGVAGRRCFAGLDLASTTDIAALVLFFPVEAGGGIVIPVFWVPAENVARRVGTDRVPYESWIAQGLLRATPGNVIDYDIIRRDIGVLGESVEIQEIAFDRWGATQLSTQLEGDGFTMVPFGQGFASMAAPTKEFLGLVAAGKLAHGRHPVLRWMASNFAVKEDAAGNLKPDKASSSEKIDGIVALIMGLDRASRHAAEPPALISVMG
jgi:phage terminase large subunit-like protein